MSRHAIRVLLVDDHAVVREGYRSFLQKHSGIEVVAEAGDAAAAYQRYKETRPDVVVMDISMPGRGGIDATEHLRRWDPLARVLIFTMHAEAAYALQAFRAGAKGYVTKSSEPEILVSAVKDIAEGRLAICQEISAAIAMSSLAPDASGLEDLSPREFEILRMILAARTTDEIATTLNLSRKTAANYHYTIKSKLRVTSDIDLLYFGLRNGLVGPVVPPKDAGS